MWMIIVGGILVFGVLLSIFLTVVDTIGFWDTISIFIKAIIMTFLIAYGTGLFLNGIYLTC